MKSTKLTLVLFLTALLVSLTVGSFFLADRLGYRGSILDLEGVTGKVGQEDVNWATAGAGAAETYSVSTWSGGTTTLTKIHAGHVPFYSVGYYLNDLVDGGYDLDLNPEDIYQEEATNVAVVHSRRSTDGAGNYRYERSIDGDETFGDGSGAGDTYTKRTEEKTYKIYPRLLLNAFQSFTDADTTPSVGPAAIGSDLPGNLFKTANTGATTITMFDDGDDGQWITVVFGDSNTTIDFSGTNLTGHGGIDWAAVSGDVMNCSFDGSNWYCLTETLSVQAWAITNDLTDRTYDANATDAAELADVVATLIKDLEAKGLTNP